MTCKDCIHYEVCMDYTTLAQSSMKDFEEASVLCDHWVPKPTATTAYWDWQHDGTHFCSNCGHDALWYKRDENEYVENCSLYCSHCGVLMTKRVDKNE